MLSLYMLVISIWNVFQVDVLESRLRVALQNSKHSFDSECPLYTPDNAQSLLVGYVEEANNENPPGTAFIVNITTASSF